MVIILWLIAGCDQPDTYTESLVLAESWYQKEFISELENYKIKHQFDENGVLHFSIQDKNAVYAILDRVMEANPDNPIEVSCEPTKTLTKKSNTN